MELALKWPHTPFRMVTFMGFNRKTRKNQILGLLIGAYVRLRNKNQNHN